MIRPARWGLVAGYYDVVDNAVIGVLGFLSANSEAAEYRRLE